MTLFTAINYNTISNSFRAEGKIYGAEYTYNNTIVRSLIPCYNKNIEEYGLYDTVEGVFYGNSGTGKFLGKSFVEEGEDPKILEYEQYFIDNDLTQSSTTTIIGTGAENDPYIINSSKDFWWASKYLDCSNKFVELGCDIILNEEKYDEDGNIVPGTSADGRVYKWSRGFGSASMVFDGKRHTVYGLYGSSNLNSAILLQADIVENLTNSGFYYGSDNGSVYGICQKANRINNCHTKNGYFIIKQSWAGNTTGIGNATVYIGNCSNNVDMASQQNPGKGIGECDGIIENCVNYGNLSCGAYSGGIGRAPVIRNCTNYGNISNVYSGGITCSAGYTSLNVMLDGCKNYGNITDIYCGGLVGSLAGNGKITLKNCEVDCQNGSYGLLFGGLVGGNLVIAENCKIKSYGTRILGSTASSDSYLKNCEIEVEDYAGDALYFFCSVYNTKIKIKELPGWWAKRLYLTSNSKDANLKNIYIETDYDLKNSSLFNTKNGDPKCLDGIIVKTPNNKYFYGNDFSAYHVDWKTGALRQNWATSVGFFQARVDVATLEKMGYTKQTY